MIKNLLSIVVIVLALFQGPYLYYNSTGLFGFLILFPYVITGLILTIWLLIAIILNKKRNSKFHVIALIFAIFLGTISLFSEEFMEKADWRLREVQRNEIIKKIKTKEFNSENGRAYYLSESKYKFISNGGNEIIIEQAHDRYTITFFIDRGLLDHYTAFIYTDDPLKIKEFDTEISKPRSVNDYKITDNWYRMSY